VTVAQGTYRELRQRWEALRGAGTRLSAITCRPGGPDLLLAEHGDASRPAIAIAAGVHGDEPAGVEALLELAQANALDPRFCYRIWPCTNVDGFVAGTRENAAGTDLNRTFAGAGESPEAREILRVSRTRPLALSLDLHEDRDACGFYCYEYGGGSIGRRVVDALGAAGFDIDPLETTFELAGPLEESDCEREPGRITTDAAREASMLEGCSYSLALAQGMARHALTFESPSARAWRDRVAMHRAAVLAAIAALAEESASTPFK
jgi:murein peptide amidase A